MKPRQVKAKSRPGEKWLQYAPGYYLSSHGRWFSAKSNKLLKQHKNDSGYYRACIFFPCGKTKFIFTHIAVVSLFGDRNGNVLPKTSLRKEGLSIDHVTRCKRNNGVLNLEIVKHTENVTRFYVKVGRSRPVIPEEIDEELFS